MNCSTDILSNAVGGIVVEVVKFLCKCIYPKIESVVWFSSNVENLTEKMEMLTKLRDNIKGKVDEKEGEGYKTKPNVVKWIKDVEKLENDWETMKENIEVAKTLTYKCCPNCCLRSKVSTQLDQNIRDQLCSLKQVGESFGSNLMVENYRMEKVDYLEVPSIQDQPAARKNIDEILRILENDEFGIIGVWGAGGIGKTTLVKNLNNELKHIDVSIRSKLSFGVVIWVSVPKPPIEIRKVQAQIADRLNIKVDAEGSEVSIASKISGRLKQEKSFVVILDDVWDAIDLDRVGVPQPKDHTGRKVIITSRFLNVCKQMKIDTEMKVYTLNENESWALFMENVGDVANWKDIEPLAMEIARECDGLPLAITVIGASLRGKNMVEQWEDALESLRKSEPNDKNTGDKVYKVIKWSFDSLEKRGNSDIQSCFLYCSLYPASIPTNDLIHCWWAEGFLGEFDTYEKAYNRGITIIEELKNACLLEEAHEKDCVKMHDVVRDVAKWIDGSFGLTDISRVELVSASVKRISFVSNKIQCLPDCFKECPKTISILLKDNEPLVKIPDEFFLSFPALRVVNLSQTGIRALPCSINSLCELRALILQNCNGLKELPPIGNLCNLQLLDCDNTRLRCLPQGMDKLTDLRLLNMPVSNFEESIGKGFFQKLFRLEVINMMGDCLGLTFFDEISSLHNLTSLFIRLDNSSIFNGDHTWMSRLKRFRIEVGKFSYDVPFNKSRREIIVSKCETFSSREVSGMFQFASHLYLEESTSLSKLFAYNSFDGLKSLHIESCSCDFGSMEEGSGNQINPLPNLEHLSLVYVDNLKSVSDFSHLRFSKLRQLDINICNSLTCLFNVGGSFSVPLEEITISHCEELVELFVQCSSSQIPRIRKLVLRYLPKLGTLGEPWEHLEELKVISCNEIRKLPRSIQTSNKIKLITGTPEWWSQLEWDNDNDNDNFKSNLEHCFTESYW